MSIMLNRKKQILDKDLNINLKIKVNNDENPFNIQINKSKKYFIRE